ncbi:MAG: hypothetical protein HRU34_11210 [Richelia sp.]|nr:hypothetical protein [Richelia sp.]CDN11412.1 O-methyltransferase family protein [C1] [Richelia intracellularis]
MLDVAESGDDFTKFSTISQWFQTLIDPALMQRPLVNRSQIGSICLATTVSINFVIGGLTWAI